MTWCIITACFFPNERPIRMLTKSLEIHGIRHMLRTYGMGEQYFNWTQMKVNRMIPELERLLAEGFTHYLYTDGRDAFFLRPWASVMQCYKRLGSPDMLLSGTPTCFPLAGLASHWPSKERYRFHDCGGYMGSIEAWLETHRRFVKDRYEDRPCGGDEATVWQWAWVDGWFRPAVDHQCAIFQNFRGAKGDVTVFMPIEHQQSLRTGQQIEAKGTVINKHTYSNPCVLHFSDFDKDAESGVFDAMKPWWDAVYPDHPITKEEVCLK